jgi:hypothetical protein
MRMTKDADIRLDFLEQRSSALCELSAFVQNMTNGDVVACQFDHGLGRRPTLLEPIIMASIVVRLNTRCYGTIVNLPSLAGR